MTVCQGYVDNTGTVAINYYQLMLQFNHIFTTIIHAQSLTCIQLPCPETNEKLKIYTQDITNIVDITVINKCPAEHVVHLQITHLNTQTNRIATCVTWNIIYVVYGYQLNELN